MSDLSLVATEELLDELCARADNLVLWYRKANDTTWGALKGDYVELDAVGAAVVRAVAQMEDQHPDGGADVDGTDFLMKHLEAGE